MDETSGVALALRGDVPTYQVEDGGSTELADLSAIASAKEEVLPRRRLAGGGRKAELIC
jgi:hypothetical protein